MRDKKPRGNEVAVRSVLPSRSCSEGPLFRRLPQLLLRGEGIHLAAACCRWWWRGHRGAPACSSLAAPSIGPPQPCGCRVPPLLDNRHVAHFQHKAAKREPCHALIRRIIPLRRRRPGPPHHLHPPPFTFTFARSAGHRIPQPFTTALRYSAPKLVASSASPSYGLIASTIPRVPEPTRPSCSRRKHFSYFPLGDTEPRAFRFRFRLRRKRLPDRNHVHHLAPPP